MLYVEGVKDSLLIVSHPLNAMYVKRCQKKEKTGVCGFYTTLYTEYSVLCIQAPHPSKREGLYSLLSCGFSSSPV